MATSAGGRWARTLALLLALAGAIAHGQAPPAGGASSTATTASAVTPAANPEPSAAPAEIRPAQVPAAGRQVASLAVREFGRYAIRVESKQGVALQLVDRMAGAGEVAGAAGERDGRLDLFLDRGDARLVTFGPTLGRGEARLSVEPFRKVDQGPVALPDLRPIATELADLEERSWWIEVAARRRVVIEAAGRALADLRLWQGGNWLVDAEPQRSQISPQSGQALTLLRLATDLAPGLYRLTAYGGPPLPWPRGGEAMPLHLRSGLPRRAQAGREGLTIGPFGSERFLVPGGATYFRLELPEARDAGLALSTFDPQQPFPESAALAGIGKESQPPVTELWREASKEPALVEVSGEPGQPFVLQHFRAEPRTPLSGTDVYWLGALFAGPPGDEIDATAVLFEQGDRTAKVIAAQAVELAAGRGWRRRFNLLAEATLFVRVTERGAYALASRGVAAQFRLEPLFASPPSGYRQPAARSAPTKWDLDPGYYLLTLIPTEAGIAEVEFARQGAPSPPLEPPLPAVQLGGVSLQGQRSYLLLTSQRPEVAVGPIVRKLPIDLEAALPIVVAPNATLDVTARVSSPGTLTATTETGQRLDLSVDGGPFASAVAVAKGGHKVRVRSTASEPLLATLGVTAEAWQSDRPLPTLAPDAFARLPELPLLSAASPAAFDLGRGESQTLLFEADAPALYRIETRGLLATEAVVRTRAVAALARGAENGVGRNAEVATYLRQGSYQLTVRSRGRSAGRLAAALERAAVDEGGRLTLEVPARAELPAGRALAFALKVEEEADYRLRALRLGGGLELRLEDGEGFPPGAPRLASDATVRLLPGDYRLLVLPQALPVRAVTLVERVPEPSARRGHGPFPLALDRLEEHLWTEPADEASPREPDRWQFELPASTEVKIGLSNEMEADLLRREGEQATKVGWAAPGRGFAGELARGRYELQARSSRRNNQVRYTVQVTPRALVDGLTRDLVAPALAEVAVGEAGLVELSSFGAADVRAALLDSKGQPLASGDDRPADWNFLLAANLAPGNYRLRIDPVGGASAATRIEMRQPRERLEAPWRLPQPLRLTAGAESVLLPLAFPSGADLLAIGTAGREPLGLDLEARAADGSWRAIASASGTAPFVALPLAAPPPELRLRLRSLDRRASDVSLTAFAGRAPRAAERSLASGVPLVRLEGLEPPLGLAAIDLARPGCFQPEGDAAVWQGRRPGEALAERPGAWIGDGRALWLAAPLTGGARSVRGRRAVLAAEPLTLRLAAGESVVCDLAPAPGARFVTATALGGEPLVAIVERPEQRPDFARQAAVERLRAAAMTTGGEGWVAVRNAGAASAELRLAATPLAVSKGIVGDLGSFERSLRPAEFVVLTLPPGPLHLDLALPAGAAALLPAAPIWAAERGRAARAAEIRGTLAIVNPTREERLVAGELRPATASDATPALGAGTRFERRFARAGAFALAVASGDEGARLAVRGAEAVLVGSDGSVARGASLAVPAGGGLLTLDPPPGLVSVWMDGDATDLERLGFASAAAPVALAAPAAIDLAGDERQFALVSPSRTLLAVQSATPLALALGDGEGRPNRFEAYPGGARFLAALPPGPLRLAVRGLAGEALAGRLEVGLAPLAPLAEGLGPEVLLAPGAARGFSLEVPRRGLFGVGVRAERGEVEATLFAPDGRPLASGALAWLELEPGAYTLALAAPPDGVPATARAIVVGLAPPGEGPPPEVVQALLELERGAPPAGRGVTGSEDPGSRYRIAPAARESAAEEEVEEEEFETEDSDESGGGR